MYLSFDPFDLPSDQESLVDFLSGEQWPFHTNHRPSREQVQEMLRTGTFTGQDQRTFWIMADQKERVGVIRLFDLEDVEDGAPRFDLRILKSHRNQGIGRAAVRWLTAYCFEMWPSLERIEGTTRVDNQAMRNVFRTCGYAKEGHFRESWPDGGKRYDTTVYGILRRDWASGSVTPVNFNDSDGRA